MRRLRPLTEEECYIRCYGSRDEMVKVVHGEPQQPKYEEILSGENLRRLFEERLESRTDAEAA
jgi:hypothetical protein